MQIQNQFAACGGDDYEICFTACASQRDKIQAISKSIGLPLTIIGKTIPKKDVKVKVHLLDDSGNHLTTLHHDKYSAFCRSEANV